MQLRYSYNSYVLVLLLGWRYKELCHVVDFQWKMKYLSPETVCCELELHERQITRRRHCRRQQDNTTTPDPQ